MFDGEAIHKYVDYERIIKSPVGLFHILWQSREAGYEASFFNNVLSVSYRDYNLSPPRPKQTFLKCVKIWCEGDISTLLSEALPPRPKADGYKYLCVTAERGKESTNYLNKKSLEGWTLDQFAAHVDRVNQRDSIYYHDYTYTNYRSKY